MLLTRYTAGLQQSSAAQVRLSFEKKPRLGDFFFFFFGDNGNRLACFVVLSFRFVFIYCLAPPNPSPIFGDGLATPRCVLDENNDHVRSSGDLEFNIVAEIIPPRSALLLRIFREIHCGTGIQ